LFTLRGVERLRKRITEAREAYQSVCNSNPEAREAGDSSVWHDNFAFEENQRQMHQLAKRVRDLENVLGRVEVVTVPRVPVRASVGTRVRYRLDGEEIDREAVLAGWDDGEPATRRLSYNSPLGSALLGAGSGDEREVIIAGRARSVVVVAIEPAEDA
jgi:transcription elongation GreA/GreB family factor